jgi:hypothetical protein
MGRIYLGWLALFLPLAVAAWAAPVPPPANKLEARIQEIRKSGVEKRVNGAKLEFTAEAEGDTIRLKWSLDYTGPRPPLIIVKPSLTTPGSMTLVAVYTLRKDGEVGEAFLGPPARPGIVVLQEQDFLRLEKGKRATGTITVPVEKLRERLAARYPGEFTDPPAEVYMRLTHGPSDRGDRYGLDAWVGVLYTDPVKLSLSKK